MAAICAAAATIIPTPIAQRSPAHGAGALATAQATAMSEVASAHASPRAIVRGGGKLDDCYQQCLLIGLEQVP